MRRFSSEFLWGATASSHQVEGGNFRNDWWAWEQRPGRIADASTSRTAADHATRYESDFHLARKLGLNAHFLTLEWSRIQPSRDTIDAAGLEHYRRVFQALRALDIAPMCALHHITLPNWFAERGGWEHPDAAAAFGAYSDAVVDAFGDVCSWWVPVMEPMYAVTQQYFDGLWPPQKRSWRSAWRALRHMAQAHGYTYARIHHSYPEHRVGLHVRAQSFAPLDENSAWDLRAAHREGYRRTRSFIQGIRTGRWPRTAALSGTAPTDFDFLAFAPEPCGVVRFDWRALHRQCARDLTRGSEPATAADLRQALRALEPYGRPLVILGDGIATDRDEARRHLLLDHLSALQGELDAGAQVLGYFHRALLDGFEWTRGYTARYGLIHVDWKSLARTPNMSAYLFKDIIESGEIRSGAAARFCPEWRSPRDSRESG